MTESSKPAPVEIDHTLTHVVTRVSTGAPSPFRAFFNPIGRSLEWNPADAETDAGSPQGVCSAVADVITSDASLAPHFRVEPLPPAAGRARATRRGEPAE